MEIKNYSLSFKARITPEYIQATNILRKFKNLGIQSPSYVLSEHIPHSYILAIKNTKNRLEIVQETPKLYGCTDNSFYLVQSIKQHNPITRKSNPFFRKFYKITDILDNKIVKVRKFYQSKKRGSRRTVTDRLKEAVLKHKTGNCFEQSIMLRDELAKAGLESKLVNSSWFDHSFLVLNLDKNANIANPKTWGKKAFIVDAWIGKVFRNAQEALTEYKRMWLLPATEIRNMKKNKLSALEAKNLDKSALSKLQFDLFRETVLPD